MKNPYIANHRIGGKPLPRAPYALAWATFCLTFIAVFTAESAVLSAALAMLR
jgi:hypothetical protein